MALPRPTRRSTRAAFDSARLRRAFLVGAVIRPLDARAADPQLRQRLVCPVLAWLRDLIPSGMGGIVTTERGGGCKRTQWGLATAWHGAAEMSASRSRVVAERRTTSPACLGSAADGQKCPVARRSGLPRLKPDRWPKSNTDSAANEPAVRICGRRDGGHRALPSHDQPVV
ncbi:hypothetical protein C2845_PM01G44270 [Panicum miliaceum]|uniref:Uncharacterized protein n=1 Tax=Panicum miliaceum TaxID=4540 RepID=A0A3L6TM92_PANMI|nr:hypothetical protein C2845_PM01G44270 [Panicum miliaceum]